MKKRMTRTLALTSAFCTIILPTSAQPWTLNGTSSPPVTAVNNIFGTDASANFPIKFHTAGIPRMHLNQTTSYNVNAQGTIPRNGFLGIGNPLNFMPPSFGAIGPFSVLHINGLNGGFLPQQFGYRNWMHYGNYI